MLVISAWSAGLLFTKIGRRILIGGVAAGVLAVAVFPDAFLGVQSRFANEEETQSRFVQIAATLAATAGDGDIRLPRLRPRHGHDAECARDASHTGPDRSRGRGRPLSRRARPGRFPPDLDDASSVCWWRSSGPSDPEARRASGRRGRRTVVRVLDHDRKPRVRSHLAGALFPGLRINPGRGRLGSARARGGRLAVTARCRTRRWIAA